MNRARMLDEQAARDEALAVVERLGSDAKFAYGVGLYHGEGAKSGRSVKLVNTSPGLMLAFVTWLRRYFDVDESRLRLRLYLHDGLDLDAAMRYWSDLLDISITQFQAPHRPSPRPGVESKHPMGCITLVYSCAATYRRVMALVEAVSSWVAVPG